MTILRKVYDFFADKNEWDKVSNEEQLILECEKRIIRKLSSMYNIEDLSLLSSIYSWGNDQDAALAQLKVVNDNITEYYMVSKYYTKDFDKTFNSYSVALDMETDEILEYYFYDLTSDCKQLKEMKYSKDKKFLQVNYGVSTFEDLPEEFKDKLVNFPNKESIFGYASKPYGKIIEAYDTRYIDGKIIAV